MNEKELLEALVKSVDAIQSEIKSFKAETNERFDDIQADLQTVKERTQRIEDRTLKIEVTIENETNKNIQLMMEAQSMNAEKLQGIEITLDDIESSVIATKAITMQNIRDIKNLKRKAQ